MNMRKVSLGRPTRSIYVSLACLSLALHLLLAFFCLSVLHTSCVLPPTTTTSSFFSSSSSNAFAAAVRKTADELRQSILALSMLTASPPAPAPSPPPPQPKLFWAEKLLNQTITVKALRPKGTMADAAANESKLIATQKLIEKVKSRDKLEALFRHGLYNLPRRALRKEDHLLLAKLQAPEKDSESYGSSETSGQVKGFEKFSWMSDLSAHPPWLRFHMGISRWELYNRNDPNLTLLTHDMATQRILGAVQKSGGTQLKLIISYPNYGRALLKPMKQARDEETNENLFYFSDFERHNSEISAFHLDRVLGFNRVPPIVGRHINVVTEIKEITRDRKLSRTFFTSPAGNVCFYGECDIYCSPQHPVCGGPHMMEASLAVMLPDSQLAPRRSWKSPWRRSYSRSKTAEWQRNPSYCDKVKRTAPYNIGTRLVDFMDMVVLDFLMSNMDRHHYETFQKFGDNTFLLHLDNGRGIRESTYLRLHLLASPSFRLSDVMRESLSEDPLTRVAPLLSEPHLAALDRRLAFVLQTVKTCLQHHQDVLYNDLENYEEFKRPVVLKQ